MHVYICHIFCWTWTAPSVYVQNVMSCLWRHSRLSELLFISHDGCLKHSWELTFSCIFNCPMSVHKQYLSFSQTLSLTNTPIHTDSFGSGNVPNVPSLAQCTSRPCLNPSGFGKRLKLLKLSCDGLSFKRIPPPRYQVIPSHRHATALFPLTKECLFAQSENRTIQVTHEININMTRTNKSQVSFFFWGLRIFRHFSQSLYNYP